MRAICITNLVLISLFTGGCVLGFIAFYSPESLLLSGPGLLIAAGCIAWLVWLTRKDRKP